MRNNVGGNSTVLQCTEIMFILAEIVSATNSSDPNLDDGTDLLGRHIFVRTISDVLTLFSRG